MKNHTMIWCVLDRILFSIGSIDPLKRVGLMNTCKTLT